MQHVIVRVDRLDASNIRRALQFRSRGSNAGEAVHVDGMHTTFAPTFLSIVRVIGAQDLRDLPGGEAIPFGLAFDFEGPAGRVCWSVNTGWFAKPVLTATLLLGEQVRRARPGSDSHLADQFPQSMGVTFIPAGDIESPQNWIKLQPKQDLLSLLVGNGQEAVFAELASLYDERINPNKAS